jgi:GxxExxY protein
MNGMQMDGRDARLLEPVTERIIRCAFRVANAPGHGFVEKIYENALAYEMRKCGLGVVQQRGIVVFYDDVIVGEFTADLLVEDQVIVELKVVAGLSDVHLPQCRNYLRATGKSLCLLINFGRPKVEIRRVTNGDQFRPGRVGYRQVTIEIFVRRLVSRQLAEALSPRARRGNQRQQLTS